MDAALEDFWLIFNVNARIILMFDFDLSLSRLHRTGPRWRSLSPPPPPPHQPRVQPRSHPQLVGLAEVPWWLAWCMSECTGWESYYASLSGGWGWPCTRVSHLCYKPKQRTIYKIFNSISDDTFKFYSLVIVCFKHYWLTLQMWSCLTSAGSPKLFWYSSGAMLWAVMMCFLNMNSSGYFWPLIRSRIK